MFNRVLVVEDIEIANYGIIKTLVDNKIVSENSIVHTPYCDKAMAEVAGALKEKNPFDLMITDLSFDRNYRDERIPSGKELIDKVRGIQPKIKIIVYSIEDKAIKVKSLFSKQKINGFVSKDGYDSRELLDAITQVHEGKTYTSSHLSNILDRKNLIELNEFNTKLVKKLASGYSQKEVAQHFKLENITPNSVSIIEKRLEKLKDDFNAKSTTHLIVILKDFGLI
ncbi:response regulator [Aureisphaera galaxeae]|uniref:DNA-binding response regulator n=1 Tax=Aureisphaera galaxeae TaxID=1538023 RepID=UPI00235013ED|nr:response regulator [Aureisphaera galaxeae]MDC8003106.1 response regulator [Aureisphaera galaxeae]